MVDNKVIGIISYLPDDKIIRTNRIEKLLALIRSCNRIFNLPIIVIAQNWDDKLSEQVYGFGNIFLKSYDKLGIVGARNTLREHFLKSPFEYLIMLDDDCILDGSESDGDFYKNQIDEHPKLYYEYNRSLLKLFAISKGVFEKVDFDIHVNPEDGTGFEDRLFYNKLLKLYPDMHYTFKKLNLSCKSTSTNDSDSTWYKDQNLKKMLENTQQWINNIN